MLPNIMSQVPLTKGLLTVYVLAPAQVWTFVISNAVVRSSNTGHGMMPEMRSSKLKIVCVDSKLVDPETAVE